MMGCFPLSDGRSVEIGLVDEAETRALRREVLRPDAALSQLAERAPGSIILGARADWMLVSTLCVAPAREPGSEAPGQWRLQGMATSALWRGLGIGGALLGEAIRLLGARPDAAILWCDGRIAAGGFYERHGFTRCGASFETPSGLHCRFRLALPLASSSPSRQR